MELFFCTALSQLVAARIMVTKARLLMQLFILRSISVLSVLAFAPTCTHARPARAAVVLDPNGSVRSFYGVPVSLTRSGLKRLPFRVKKGQYSGEGKIYTNYTISAVNGVRVVVEFNDDGTLYEAESASPNAVGSKGVGVGSTLGDVRKAWPGGTLLYGSADGEYVTYITGTNVLLRFNPHDMPPGAFNRERPYDFPVPDTIKVQKISVYPKPNPMPKGLAPPDPNKNFVTAQTADGKIISRLDVERMPIASRVRLIWTHHGKMVADRIVDVSQFPDFDIWTRSMVHDTDPVVVSFRFGNFKNCSVTDDDRDKVYVTLGSASATISISPPKGVKTTEDFSMPKYVGNSMKSAAHGCRRTYNPVTGTFGLDSSQ